MGCAVRPFSISVAPVFAPSLPTFAAIFSLADGYSCSCSVWTPSSASPFWDSGRRYCACAPWRHASSFCGFFVLGRQPLGCVVSWVRSIQGGSSALRLAGRFIPAGPAANVLTWSSFVMEILMLAVGRFRWGSDLLTVLLVRPLLLVLLLRLMALFLLAALRCANWFFGRADG
ncbi:uncharacterized protein LOC125518095 [Triticum urartu]|uniref:uncharacterized protein LOC125518095 n=1 Tax=Triticum urartu TaxID=4572 RepID=UPI002043378E|nr:uncharacterized protein LOC125518095 [Triticum urartu]